MRNLQRIEFVTRHLLDLQTIRFAPVPMTMLLAPLAAWRTQHVSREAAWAMLLGFLSVVAGVYWWSTFAIRRRYGSVKLSREEGRRMMSHPMIVAIQIVLAATLIWFYFFAPHTYSADVYLSVTIAIIMLRKILDSTNPASRRLAWAIGLVILFTSIPLLMSVDGGAVAVAGAVWLSLSIFDFLLLRRIFAGISASAPTATAEALVNRG
jgi:hypothetical protein